MARGNFRQARVGCVRRERLWVVRPVLTLGLWSSLPLQTRGKCKRWEKVVEMESVGLEPRRRPEPGAGPSLNAARAYVTDAMLLIVTHPMR